MTVARFIDAVGDVALPSVFNPYSDRCPHFDLPNGAALRRSNLQEQIRAALDLGVDTIWIGRDLGYRGGRRTGIALTDEPNLVSANSKFNLQTPLRRATKGPEVAERTAAVVWRAIKRLDSPVLTWNVFPFHPHNFDNPFTNRCHTKAERLAVRPILARLLELLKPTRIVAIGNDAETGLFDLGFNCFKVRHPSYGGIEDFERGIASIHGLAPVPSPNPPLQLF